LALSDSKWRECPICHDSIYAKDAKSAKFIPMEEVAKSPKKSFEMVLMKRGIHSTVALPSASYDSWNPGSTSAESLPALAAPGGAGTRAPSVSSPDFAPYSKLLLSNASYFRHTILEADKRELGLALNVAQHEEALMKALLESRRAAAGAGLLNDGPVSSGPAGFGVGKGSSLAADLAGASERPFIEMALAEVKKALEMLGDKGLEKEKVNKGKVEEKRKESQQGAAWDLALGDASVAEKKNSALDDDWVSFGGSEMAHVSPPSVVEVVSELEQNEIKDTPSKDSQNGKKKQQQQQPKHRDGPPSDGFYYFYQSVDGQHYYLHPLDIKILKHEFDEYDKFPSKITVKAWSVQESTMNEDLRKRCKYLSHLPLSCDVNFCEVDLSSVVSNETLNVFESEYINLFCHL
jgi:hypothetical protein